VDKHQTGISLCEAADQSNPTPIRQSNIFKEDSCILEDFSFGRPAARSNKTVS
jgi:hypothetical protein